MEKLDKPFSEYTPSEVKSYYKGLLKEKQERDAMVAVSRSKGVSRRKLLRSRNMTLRDLYNLPDD